MAKEPTTQIAIRIPTALVDDLDRIAAQMTEETGIEISRAGIIRAALTKYVKEKTPSPPRKARRRK